MVSSARNSKTPRSRKQAREEAREKILLAARSLFAQYGYSAVALDRIAAEAGCTKGLVLHYFKSKRGLWLQVVERYVKVGAVGKALPDSRKLTKDDLVALAQSSFKFFQRNPDFHLLAARAGLEVDAEVPESMQALLRDYSAAFERAQRDGAIRDDIDPRHAHAMLYHLASAWFLTRHFFTTAWPGKDGEAQYDSAYLRDMLKVVADGLGKKD